MQGRLHIILAENVFRCHLHPVSHSLLLKKGEKEVFQFKRICSSLAKKRKRKEQSLWSTLESCKLILSF